MGFIGLIRLLALLFVIWMVWRHIKKRRSSLENKPRAHLKETAVVACAYCNTHIPKSEALEKDGRWYCSQEHSDAG